MTASFFDLIFTYKYLKGHSVPLSCPQAAEWYELAAAQAIEDIGIQHLCCEASQQCWSGELSW